jgi:hypothetical protein
LARFARKFAQAERARVRCAARLAVEHAYSSFQRSNAEIQRAHNLSRSAAKFHHEIWPP